MATTKTPAPKTPRQELTERVAVAMVGSIGYELLDQGDGKIAAQLAARALEIADAVLDASA